MENRNYIPVVNIYNTRKILLTEEEKKNLLNIESLILLTKRLEKDYTLYYFKNNPNVILNLKKYKIIINNILTQLSNQESILKSEEHKKKISFIVEDIFLYIKDIEDNIL
jgi:hypothetical protein